MGRKSRSSSSQSQTTNNVDNSAVVEDEAINVAGSTNTNITVNRLDAGIVDDALDGIERTADRALDFGDEALDRALDFGESALDKNKDVLDRALDFADESQENATNTINAANAGLQGLTGKVIDSLVADKADSRETASEALIASLGKYATIIAVGGAAAYAYSRKK